MTIKPIDLQTNISQMLEVGRGEHAKTEALAEQQHLRDEQAAEKSKLTNSKLDESKKGEQTSIKDEEKEKRKRNMSHGHDDETGDDSAAHKEKKPVKDDRMGRFIDVLK